MGQRLRPSHTYVHGSCRSLISGQQGSGATEMNTGPWPKEGHVETSGEDSKVSGELELEARPRPPPLECQGLLEAPAAGLPP